MSVCEIASVLYFTTKKVNTYSEVAGILVQTNNRERKRKREALNATRFVEKTWVVSQDQEGKEVQQCAAAMGGSQWKHQETVRFPPASSTAVIGEHFLSPWLQETGQGCHSFFFFFLRGLRRRARNQAELQTTQCLIGWSPFRSLPSFFSHYYYVFANQKLPVYDLCCLLHRWRKSKQHWIGCWSNQTRKKIFSIVSIEF